MISPTVDSVQELRLPPTPQAPGQARRAVRQCLAGAPEETLEAATLLVSELVTNSVRHSGTSPHEPLIVRVANNRSAVRIEVCDWGRGFKVEPRTLPMDSAGGWGLPLVERLSRRWGVQSGPPTTVWFELG